MGRLSNSDQMHLRGGTICGAQMSKNSMTRAAEMQIGNMGKAINDSGAGFGGLVSMT